MTKICDFLVAAATAVSPATPITEVASRMKAAGTNAVAVCSHGKFRGIVTETDIVTGIVAASVDPDSATAATVINKDYPIVPPGADMAEAVRVMARRGVTVLPVAQDGVYLGLLTLEDIMRRNRAFGAVIMCTSRNN